MALGHDRDLYMLAFDHRGSFQKGLFGISGTPTAEEKTKIADTKTLIFEGFVESGAGKQHPDAAGILVDEEFGTPVARRAKELGAVLAMPVEKSGQDEFDFEFGDDFPKHIESFDPTFAKVLVRYNPEDDATMNARQTKRLARLATWLHDHGRKFLFELLVPATPAQLAKVGKDQNRYDTEVRPGLVVETIRAMQAAGVEADIWKIEGLDSRADCERVSAQARSGGRDGVCCIVLGRGANATKVAEWLRAGAGVPGYRGFAIGRTIWWDALKGFRDGSLDRAAAAKQIAANYNRAIETYRAGSK